MFRTPHLGSMGSGSGSVVRLLRAASALLFPHSHLTDATEPLPRHRLKGPAVCLSAVGRHKITGRQSFQSRFTSSLCLSSCRQSRQTRSSISVIPFLSFFPSFPWETQDTYVSSHQVIPSLPFLSTNQNSSPQPISSMPSFCFVFCWGWTGRPIQAAVLLADND